jgi:hypothetical protein
LITILGTSFVGPVAARFAFMLVACAGLVLQTPTPALRDLDASAGPDVVECQASADPARDRKWTNDIDGSASDACDDDDDDDDDDESSTASGLATFSRAYLAPDFSDSTHVGEVTEGRHGARGRDVYLLRGPPAVPMESSDPLGDTAGTHPAPSGCGEKRRDPHAPLFRNPFRTASAQSVYGLRAPP